MLDGFILVPKIQDEPWYLNIPKEGVKCWVKDSLRDVKEERDRESSDTRTVCGYDPIEEMPFITERLSWPYAIPVDPKLRLPNGAIVL